MRLPAYSSDVFTGRLFESYGSYLPIISESFLLERSYDSLMVLKHKFSDETSYTLPAQEGEYLKFYLHAVAIRPSVSIVPDELILKDLEIGKRETRVLELTNSSVYLPIIASYKKVPFVDVEPKSVLINARSSIQVSVFVIPNHLKSIDTEVRFDLMYYDYPRENSKLKVIGKVTAKMHIGVRLYMKRPLPEINRALSPNYIKEVGKCCQNVTFNDAIKLPKLITAGAKLSHRGNDLIAFPNDRQASLRPWRSGMRCKTIFTKYPRYEPPLDTDNELTFIEKQFKKDNNDYYASYLRKESERRKSIKSGEPNVTDYDVTRAYKLINADVKLPDLTSLKLQRRFDKLHFIALTPSQMNNVVIYPMTINTGSIVSFDRYHFTINIKNGNSFPILVYTRSEHNVLFPEGNKRIIKESTEIKIAATYISHSVGYYTCNVDVIINECIVFVVTILADVCGRYLQLDKECVNFVEESTREFIEITNTLNAEILFSWHLTSNNFEIEPADGAVKPFSTMVCQVQYFPEEDGPQEMEAEFFSGDKYTHLLKVSILCAKVKLEFVPNELVFENIPLNMPVTQYVTLMNRQNRLQAFSVRPSGFSQYLQVRPPKGIITGNSKAVISLTITVPVCATFSTNVVFDVAAHGTVTLPLKGNVIYPDIIVSPQIIQFKKIPASSRAFLPFTLTNRCFQPSTVRFELYQYREYAIHDSIKWWETAPVDMLTLPAGGMKNLYLHFSPTQSFRDMFFLPMIVNDLLGPVQDEPSSKIIHFDLSPRDWSFQRIDIPKTLPWIKVVDYATAPKLQFSKLHINLHYSLIASTIGMKYKLRICNLQKHQDDVCIRTKYLQHPLHIDVLGDKEVTQYTSSIVCTLLPNEEVAFLISFQPEDYGQHQGRLPIFLRSDNTPTPHNIVTVTANYFAPTIQGFSPTICLKPIPIGLKVTYTTWFNMRGHADDCLVICKTDNMDVTVDWKNSPSLLNDEMLLVTWNIEVRYRTQLRIICKISCSCKTESQVCLLGSVDNCLLTTYAFIGANSEKYYQETRDQLTADILPSLTAPTEIDSVEHKNVSVYSLNEFFHEYPSYPASDSEITDFLDTCVIAMESWIHSQGLFGTAYYSIPTDISIVTIDDSKNKKKDVRIPFLDLLMNLTGRTVEKRLKMTLTSNEPITKALHCYDFYKKAIEFLDSLGAFLSHISPEHLLDYTSYHIYMEHQCQDTDEKEQCVTQTLDIEKFEFLSKQCWLDVILQTYKVLVLNTITRQQEPNTVTSKKFHHEFHQTFPVQAETPLYNPIEVMLLQWLQYHFEEARRKHWSETEHLYPKKLIFFDEDMNDGFVFAAVTLRYCPYLEEHFKKLYLQPQNYEENLHNNILVVQSWKMLNLSMDLPAQTIISSHPLVNLMLAAYLYEVLPDMYPCETIEFVAGLSQSCTRCVEIKNQNSFPVAYKAIFIGNKHEDAFSIVETFYIIKPMKKRNIIITYTAKYIREYKCVLILSGESKGYRYAKNKVVTLIAKPDVNYVVNTMGLCESLYISKEVHFKINSPYQAATRYKIQFSTKECSTISEVHALPCNRDMKSLAVYRIFPLDSEVDCDHNGEFLLRILLTMLLHMEIPCWFYFTSCEMGAFCVKIVSMCDLLPAKQEKLEVVVPKLDDSTVTKRKEPRQILQVKISKRNKLMRNTIMETLMRTCRGETEFLKTIVTTATGLHVLEKLIIIYTPVGPFSLCKPTEYNIIANRRSNIILPRTIRFEDMCYAKDVVIPFRYLPSTSLPKDFTFTLRSDKTHEVRFYKVHFVYEED